MKRRSATDWAPPGRSTRPRWRIRPRLWTRHGGRRLRALTGPARAHRPPAFVVLSTMVTRHRWRAGALVGAPVGGLVSLAAGDTAGALTAVYVATAVVLAASRRVERLRVAAFARGLDAVSRLAAELRAGADPEVAVTRMLPTVREAGGDAARLARRLAAATTVAEQTGAPLSGLLDRLEADEGASARIRALADAHAAGARATAWLLAALPAAGIGLGYSIGTSPLHVLLHTTVGAVATVLAVGLQIAGLVWTRRLGRRIGDQR